MRTFPKSLAQLRKIVDERGKRLRTLRFEQLAGLSNTPTEHLTIDSRPTTIDIIVNRTKSGDLKVVVQGFMKARLLGKHVAVHGFFKHANNTVSEMSSTELCEFD